MKSTSHSTGRRTRDAELARRARLLETFDRSGLSAAAFARQHRLTYTTFCNWRQQRAKTKRSPAFVQVELPTPAQLTIELPAGARVRLSSIGQVELAARLLQALNAQSAC